MPTAIMEAPILADALPELTQKGSAERAVNQLLAVIVGRRHAQETDSLKNEPSERIQACLELAGKEYMDAVKSLRGNPDNQRLVNQVQRKMDSLGSLQTLANLIKECEW